MMMLEEDALTTQKMQPRLLELIMQARRIAGDKGPILVEASSGDHDEVLAGYGGRFAGCIGSRFLLMQSARFASQFDGGRRFSAPPEAELDACEELGQPFFLGQTLRHAQVALMTGTMDDLPALIPLLHRVQTRHDAVCVIAPGFDPALVKLLVTKRQVEQIDCSAFCTCDEMRERLRQLCGRIRRTTGFFGKHSVSVTLFFDLVEVRAQELLVFNSTPIGNLPPAARILITQPTSPRNGSAIRAVRKALISFGNAAS